MCGGFGWSWIFKSEVTELCVLQLLPCDNFHLWHNVSCLWFHHLLTALCKLGAWSWAFAASTVHPHIPTCVCAFASGQTTTIELLCKCPVFRQGSCVCEVLFLPHPQSWLRSGLDCLEGIDQCGWEGGFLWRIWQLWDQLLGAYSLILEACDFVGGGSGSWKQLQP